MAVKGSRFLLKDSIADSIRRHGFKRLLLAVSGGLDSICLAHYFIANREALDIEWLGIAHVHHGLREGTADRDAAFVEAFAKAHDVPFFLKKLDGEALKSAKGSLEENARNARYKALFDVTLEALCADRVHQALDPILSLRSRTASPLQDDTLNASKMADVTIVTAHHAGDQTETMYMRLRRGTTLAGLRGIQDVRDNIYRPFLNVTREELLAYARENNLKWCEDESNSDVKFTRNKVRHVYLPQLARGYCDAATQLCRIASLADKAYAKVMDKCNELFNPIVSLEKEMPELVGHDKSLDPAPSNLTQLRQQIAKFRISTPRCSAQDDTSLTTRPSSLISLNKKALRKILLAHANADLSEMFRLWLSEQGFRFPIGFFYSQSEPAHVKIPVRAAYRKRSIVKNGSTILICEFEDVQTASKFVSCGKKE